MQRDVPGPFRPADSFVGGPQQLFAALYAELHQLAERQLRARRGDVTLSATTLVHETYLDIAGRDGVDFPDRARFMGYVARTMRGIVIDHARRARAEKRGGGIREITLGDSEMEAVDPGHGDGMSEVDALSVALDDLAHVEPALAELVELHFFCGFSLVELATLRGVCDRTVQRDWRKARIFLAQALLDEQASTAVAGEAIDAR